MMFTVRSRQQIQQNSNPLRSCFGFDSSATVAQAVMNSRSGLFAKQRSQSFIDHGVGNPSLRSMTQSSTYSEWGSPDGKPDWVSIVRILTSLESPHLSGSEVGVRVRL
ncbi:hypothetical protein HanIR_Chr01g0009551 [Helianthus annuus]|nr:hypothetical protein HanIR_Chr01g0009551 [Helianthus annuus]